MSQHVTYFTLLALALAAACMGAVAAQPNPEQRLVDRVKLSYGRLARHHRVARALRGSEELDDIDALYRKQIQHASGEHEQPDPFKPHHVKTCHPDCGKRGTCDHQFGRCLCPFGFTGPACQEMLLPACRMVNMTLAEAEAMGHSLVLTCAASAYRNCECNRQCWQFYCRNDTQGNEVCELWRDRNEKCYTYAGLPPEQQVSVMPPQNATGVEYYKGFLKQVPKGAEPPERINRTTFQVSDQTRSTQLPLSECPGNCSYRGICQAYLGLMQPSCSCFTGYDAMDCSAITGGKSSWCPRNCNGRGTCDRGFCHCRPGWFGLDCSKNTTFQARPQPPYSGHLKVYVYDLPSEVAFQDGYFPGWRWHNELYLGFWYFFERLLNDTSIRTDDPYEANLFYVPALAYYYSGNIGDAGVHIKKVVSYLKQEYPFWNRTQGRDHVVWIPNDRGACYLDSRDPDLDNIMVVTHFGLHQAPGNKQVNHMWIERRNGCFKPGRDVVAPANRMILAAMARHTYLTKTGSAEFEQRREVQLVFAGDIRSNDLSYSGGVRQELYHIWAGATTYPNASIQVYKGQKSGFEALVKKARFCLAPYGWGWGIRISEMMVQGCVPVIIQDHVYQPLEDVLPYDDFSVRLPKADIPRVKDLLEGISDEEWQRMHDNLKLYWRAFVWDEDVGGKAYEHVVASLRKRIGSLQVGLFRR